MTPQIQIKEFVESIHPGHFVEVKGYRPSARGAGGKKPLYTAQVFIDGRVFMTAQERDWRLAYKTLQVVLSKVGVV